MVEEGKINWDFWPTHFEKINKLDEISIDTLLEIIEKYKKAQKFEIWVKHQHYGSSARIVSFNIDTRGRLDYLRVVREDGATAFWGADKCKLTNRPTKKRKTKTTKIKQVSEISTKVKKQKNVELPTKPAAKTKRKAKTKKASAPVPCTEHPKYTGKRKPRTGCSKCMAFYNANKK